MSNLPNYELFIIDNGSKEDIFKIVEPYLAEKIKYIKVPINSPNTFNKSFSYGSGKYLLITHDDDILLSHMIEEQVRYFIDDSNVIAVSANAIIINENGDKVNKKSHKIECDEFMNRYEYINKYLNDDYSLMTPSVLMDRKFIKSNNLKFNINVGPAADNFFWFECNMTTGTIVQTQKCLYKYRLHDKQDGHINANSMEIKMLPYLYEIIKESVQSKKQRAQLLAAIRAKTKKHVVKLGQQRQITGIELSNIIVEYQNKFISNRRFSAIRNQMELLQIHILCFCMKFVRNIIKFISRKP